MARTRQGKGAGGASTRPACDPEDTHSRYIEAEVDGIVVGCLYLPNGNPAPGPKFDYKLRWFDRLISYGQLLLREGKPDNVHLVKEGLGCRYTLLENGNRSVTALLLPGDFCNLHVAILGQMDHGIATLASSRIVKIPRTTIEDLINNPRIVRALWWSTLVDEGTMRAWLVSSGRRQANRQMAHLFCELLARLEAVGLADEGNSTFPSRRRISGIYLELQQVHGNKTLKALRENGLVLFDGKRVTIPDPTRMAEFAEFDPLYLHLRKRHTQKSVAPSAYLADRA